MPRNTLITLTEEDVALLQDVLDRVRRDGAGASMPVGPTPVTAAEDYLPPEVYAARTPAAGLPGMVGGVLGHAECSVWRAHPSSLTMEDTGRTVIVYNRGAAVGGDVDVFVERDKFGAWYIVTGAGGSTIDHVLITSLTPTGGLYPAKLQRYTAATDTWADTLDASGGPVVVWFRPTNGETPPLLKRVLGQRVDTLAGVAVYAAPAPRSGNLRVTSTTPGGPTGALYPANVETYSAALNTWSFVEGVWFRPSNDETPVLNLRYSAERVDVTSGVAVYAGPAPGTGITTVKEADGTPTLSGINTFILDQTSGLQLTQPSAGQAQATIQSATPTQAGVVATGTQTFGGNKVFQAAVTFQSTVFLAPAGSPGAGVGTVSGIYLAGPPAHTILVLSGGTGGTGEINLDASSVTFQSNATGAASVALNFGLATQGLTAFARGNACLDGTWTVNTPTGTVDLTFTAGWLTGTVTGTTTAQGTTTTTPPGGGGVPTVTNASPASAPHGVATSITITGTNFTGTTVVRFGPGSASFTVNSATQITATVPTGLPAGSQAITVTNASGTSSGYAFTLT
jgi:hypothetical protein